MKRLIDDCFLHDKDRLTHAETLALIRERLAAVTDSETIAIEAAAGRYLAQSVTAPRNVPLHANSAVDGYTFAKDALPAGGTLAVGPRIAAGDTARYTVASGQAARIFTGAVMPEGADTVAMQEDCSLSDDGRTVTVPVALKAGANVRLAGEDVAAGSRVLQPGQSLRPQDIATLASFGMAGVSVRRPVRVALVSTGNELVRPGAPIEPGQVYDSNHFMLRALCATLPVTVTDCGILADDPATVETAIAAAAVSHDVILTTGGASRGEEDHIVATIDRLGKRHLWQIAIKPGRPMSFGQVGDCVFLGLPGNPVAAFVCFLLYCRPALTVLGGGKWAEPQRYPLPAGFAIANKKPDRREFWRGWLEAGPDGRTVVRKFERDGSGLISGLREATGLIEISEEKTAVAEGEPVAFLPFAGFGIGG